MSAQVVAIGAPILFDSNGPMTPGITHTPGSSQILITDAGDYSIDFTISGVESSQFTLFDNAAPLMSTVFGSGAGTQMSFGNPIVTLSAGDVLTLVNFSSAAAVTLQTLAGGTQINVNASIRLMKIST